MLQPQALSAAPQLWLQSRLALFLDAALELRLVAADAATSSAFSCSLTLLQSRPALPLDAALELHLVVLDAAASSAFSCCLALAARGTAYVQLEVMSFSTCSKKGMVFLRYQEFRFRA